MPYAFQAVFFRCFRTHRTLLPSGCWQFTSRPSAKQGSYFSSSFLLLWFCFTFWLLFHLYFYFYIFSNISVVSQSNFIFYFVIVLFFFFATPHGSQDLDLLARGQVEAPAVGALSLNHWTNRHLQTPGNIHQSEVSQSSSSQHQDPALPKNKFKKK